LITAVNVWFWVSLWASSRYNWPSRTAIPRECLRYRHVIGMLFWGGTHTENPENWIVNFKNRNHTIISVVLDASLKTLIQRVKERRHDYKPPEKMKQHLNEFNKIRNTFANKAQVKEISIDTEGMSPIEVVDKILSILMNS
jgi:shikimate kinase